MRKGLRRTFVAGFLLSLVSTVLILNAEPRNFSITSTYTHTEKVLRDATFNNKLTSAVRRHNVSVQKNSVKTVNAAAGNAYFLPITDLSTCTTFKKVVKYDPNTVSGQFQSVSVPAGVTVTVEAYGANGGDVLDGTIQATANEDGKGGIGAYAKASFTTSSPGTFLVLSGQKGGDVYSYSISNSAAGGGGGSFVTLAANFNGTTNLIAVGGGGGGGYGIEQSGFSKHANTGTSGWYGAQTSIANPFSSTTNNGAGGNGTTGGGGLEGSNSGAGAGYNEDGNAGANIIWGITPGENGAAPFNFGYGGISFDGTGNGGYGGGGAAITGGGGGGGGWAGGGGGKDNGYGGGGGSFSSFSGTTFQAKANTSTNNPYYDNGNGVVIISYTIPTPVIAVSGNGNTIASGLTNTPVTTDNTDFGSTAIGTPVSKQFTISNTGTANLTVSSITFDKSVFTLDASSISLPATIAPGGSTTFTAKFTPISVVTQGAIVTIGNNACTNAPYTYKIKGTGTSATQPLTPGTIGSPQSICTGATPAGLTSTTDASGGTGTISYQWQSSTDNISFTNISGATAATYAPGALTQTTYYRRGASTSTDAVQYTSSVAVTINALPTIGGNTTLCQSATSQLTGSGTAASSNPWISSNTSVATVSNTGLVTASSSNAGTADITYTNSNGCSATVTITVNAPVTPTFTLVAPVCAGTTLSPLPTTSNNGIPGTWSPATMNNMATTQYTFTPAAGQCAATYSMTIKVYPAPNAPTGSAASACAPNGVNLTATPGISETVYWYDAATGGNQLAVGNTLNTNSSGTFYAAVKSADGCFSLTRTAVTATIYAAPVISGTPAALCIGGSAQLSGTGVAAASNAWVSSNPAIATVDNTGKVTAVAAGNVTITYTNIGGCTASTNIFVSGNPAVNTLPSGTASICSGNSVTLSSNSEPGLTYSWNPDGSTASSISVNTAGTYTLTGTNSYGCSSTASVVVSVGSLPNAPSGSNVSVCAPNGATLTATAGAGETVRWFDAATGGNQLAVGNTLNTNVSGTFYAEAVSAGGCVSASRTAITATINPLPSVSVSAGGPTDLCYGGSVVISAATGTGYTYQWLLNNNPISGATNSTYTATQAGIYTVTITTPKGCTATTGDGGVTVTTTLQPHISTGITTFCTGSSSTLQADPVSGVTYQWQKDGVNIPGANASSYTATTAGSYTLVETKTSGSGCSATSNAIVLTVNPAPAKPTISGTLVFCSTGSNFTTLTSSPAVSYHWSNGPLSQTNNVNASGSYTVTITDANGCQSTSDPVTVTANPQPNSFGVSGGGSYCAGGSGVSINLSGSETGVNYKLELNGVATGNVIAGTGSGISFTNITTAGTYTILAVNASTSCTNNMSGSVNVSVNPLPTISGITGTTTICSGNSTSLTASSAASSPNFSWYTVATGGTPVGASATLNTGTLFNSTTYYVQVSSNGCTSSARTAVTVTVNPTPATLSFSRHDNCDGTTTLSITNATGSVLWSNNATNTTITVSTTGVYSATQTVNGCTSPVSSVNVSFIPPTTPAPTVTAVDNCDGTSTLTASNYTGGIQWSTGATNVSSITVNTAGSYGARQFLNGCPSVITSVNANPKTAPVATISAVAGTTACPGGSVVLQSNSTANGYQWYKDGVIISGANSSTYAATVSGSYTLVTSVNGCISNVSNAVVVDISDVTAPTAPVLTPLSGQCSVTVPVPTANDNCSGTVTGTTSDLLTYNTQGEYDVHWTFTDAAGNTSYATQHVSVKDVTPPVINNCPSNISTTATSAAGALVNYTAPTASDNCAVTIVRTAGPASGSVFPIGTTTVTYVATDAGGNTATCSFTVTVTGVPPTIACQANFSVNAITGLCGTYLGFAATVSNAIPAATVTYTENNNPVTSGSFFAVGSHTIVATATNAVGTATCTFTFVVKDAEPPVLEGVPADATVSCASVPAAATVTATDNCSGVSAVTFTQTIVNQVNPGNYQIKRTWTVTDAAGNTTTNTQTITVVDNVPPAITCPGTITVTANTTTSGYGAIVSYTATATDNCGTPVVSYSVEPGSFFTLGTHIVTATADDGNGNQSTCDITIKVIPQVIDAVDDDYTGTPINGAHGGTTPVVLVNDVLNGNPVSLSTVNLTLLNNGGITGLAFDASGALIVPAGTWEGTYNVVYQICEIANPSNCDQAIVKIKIERGLLVTATTYCLNDVPHVSYTVTPNFTPSTLNPVTIQWLNGDGSPVTAQAAQSGLSLTGDILWPGAVLDAQGNPIDWPGWYIQNGIWVQGADGFEGTRPNAFMKISVNPTEVFQVSYPPATPGCSTNPVNRPPVAKPDVVIAEKCNAVTVQVLNNDADFENGTLTVSVAATTTANGGTLTVNNGTTITYTPATGFTGTDVFTYTITDPAGLTASASVTVTVEDHTAPTPPVLTTVNRECAATVPAPVINDPCDGTITGTTSGQTTFTNQGEYDIVWTFTDAAGNKSTATQHVIIKDVTKPDVHCPGTITRDATTTVGNTSGAYVTYTATATDNCGTPALSYSAASGSFFPIGTTTVTVTADDGNGNTSQCTFDVIVKCVPPVITSKPANQTLNTTVSRCDAPATYNVTASGIPASNLTYSFSGATTGSGTGTGSGALFNKGVTTVTVTATNQCGSDSYSFTVTVVDKEFPVITGVPANISVNSDAGKCGAVVNWTKPVSTDNCPGVVQSCTSKSGDFFPVGMTTVTVTAVDASGNTTTKSFTVTVTDNEKPVVNCPADVTVNATTTNGSGQSGAYVTYGTATTSDNCGVQSVTYSTASGSFFLLGTNTVTVTATDVNGNVSTCTFKVIVNCVAPTLTKPADITLNTEPGVCTAKATYTATGGGVPAAAITYSLSGATTGSGTGTGTGLTFNKGVTTVKLTATNSCGTVSCSFTVTVVDNENPVITGTPANISKSNDAGVCGAKVTWTAPTVSDNCPGATISSNYAPGTVFPIGTTTVVYTASDAVGHTVTSSFTVTVTDNEKPVITCPAAYTVACGLAASTSLTGTATATDNCGVTSITYTDVTVGNIITRTWKATDAAGNYSTCTQTITLQGPFGVTVTSAPTSNVYTGGVSTSLYLGYGAQSTVLTAGVPAGTGYTYQWSGASVNMLSSTTTAATTFTPTKAGSYTFTVTVKNSQGCTVAASITICVTDIRVFTSTVVKGDKDDDDDDDRQRMCNHQSHDSSNCPHKGHNHSCDHKAHTQYNCAHRDTNDKDDDDEKTCDHKAHSYKDCPHKGHNHKACDHKSHSSKDCDHDKSNSNGDQKVCDHKSHSEDDCSHDGHNHDDCDHKSHSASNCPHNGGNQYGNSGNYKVYICHVPPGNPGKTITLCISVNAVPAHLTLHPYDKLGSCDQAPCSGIPDTQKPVVDCADAITVSCNSSLSPSVTGAPTVTDNSGYVTVTYTDVSTKGTNPAAASFYNYTITRTWRATDPSGNYTECAQIITVQDKTAPVLTCPGNVTVACATANTGTATATDNSGGPVTITYTDAVGKYYTTRTWKVVDVSGNYATCSQNITVNDNVAPVITCPGDKVIGCGGSTLPTSTGYATATDNCSSVTVTYTDVTGDNGVIKRTWKAVDAAGNSSTCVQTITKPTGNPCVLPYPLADVNYPRSSVIFNESTVLKMVEPGANVVCGVTPTRIKAWYSDEHALTLGVRQVIVKTKTGTTTTNYPVSTYSGTAGTVNNPATGVAGDNTLDQSGNDVADYGGRPLRPVLYVSDITNDPNNRAGDWQHNGTAYNPTMVSGTWKAAVRVVDKTRTPAVVTVVPDADPLVKNNWTMGSGADAVPSGLTNEGYGTEVAWDISSLGLIPGHTYRVQVIVHDGDQNKCGGDAGQGCATIYIPTNSNITAVESGPKQTATKESEAAVTATNTEEELKVTVMPNPSTTFFTLKLESKYETPVNIRVMDGRGMVVDARSKVGANSTLQIGHNYSSGTYYAELIQGNTRKVVQLVKARG